MEKLKMETSGIVEGNVDKIRALFPHCITEIKGKDGKTRHAVDFDKLRAELGDDLVEGQRERYQFTWPQKSVAAALANTPTKMTLRPDRDSSVDFDNTENLYIEGDNLEVLKVLRETYLGRVKMIYIDPPYNTGKDFVYKDRRYLSQAEMDKKEGKFDEYGNLLFTNSDSNGRFHTDWLNFIYPRLKVARDLLTDDGVIFISIDENECENLRKMCDEIYGEENLVCQIPWQSRASIQNDTDFSINHEYVVVYAKKRRRENRRLKESNIHDWYKRDSFVCRPLPLDPSKFDNPDNDPRGPWKADPFDAPHVRPNLTYPITNPNTGVQHLPPRGRCWRTDSCQFSSALADGRILFGKSGEGRPQLKVFYEEKKAFGSVDNSWFSADRIGTATSGTKELMSLFDGEAYFDTPKPTSMITKLIDLANCNEGDIVLDFFSGSGTTAHAIMKYCLFHDVAYKFIMVQLGEPTPEDSDARKAGYETICHIGKERIRRAGKKIKEEAGEKGKDLDIGFRVLKLDTSNMKDVFYTPAAVTQMTIEDMLDNVKEGRSDEDLLFQVMLQNNIPLSANIEKITVNGHTAYVVAEGALIATFDRTLDDETLVELAKMEPLKFVMREPEERDGVDPNNLLDNFEQKFELYSPNTQRSIL